MANHDLSVDIEEGIDIDAGEIQDIEGIVENVEPDKDLFIAYLAGYTKGVNDGKDENELPFDDTESFKEHVADGYEKYRKRKGIYSPDR